MKNVKEMFLEIIDNSKQNYINITVCPICNRVEELDINFVNMCSTCYTEMVNILKPVNKQAFQDGKIQFIR